MKNKVLLIVCGVFIWAINLNAQSNTNGPDVGMHRSPESKKLHPSNEYLEWRKSFDGQGLDNKASSKTTKPQLNVVPLGELSSELNNKLPRKDKIAQINADLAAKGLPSRAISTKIKDKDEIRVLPIRSNGNKFSTRKSNN